MAKKVLVTGGAGLIGSHLVDELQNRNFDVRILDNLEQEVHKKGKPSWIPKDIEFIQDDVRNYESWKRALNGVKVVFHEAAYGGFSPDFSKIAEVNCVGTTLMFEAIKKERLDIEKIIVASSQAIYGEGKYYCKEHGFQHPELRSLEQLSQKEWEVKCGKCNVPMKPIPIDENTTPLTTGAYSISKYYQERLCIGLGKEYRIPAVALRYALTYGPRQSVFNPYSGICSIFSTRILNDKPPIIYEDGNQTRDFTFVKDVVQANMLVMEKAEANWEVFNVGTGVGTKVVDFCKLLTKAYKKNNEPEIPGRFRPLDLRHLLADAAKITEIGFKPRYTVEKGVNEYVNWIASNERPKDYFDEAEKILKGSGMVREASRLQEK